ncbi:conserved hypothetical protein [Paraglaciecola sp. T6c]|uniref:DUF2145 domain-containing protein n=1 Tax=Pseudoalteromonas atlantica (strain T6c / ATCC BAA-1087) TaxID=3042615 RepID=UPI00005C668F|nr:DUF2145 domain-containing protein [Paraglaciecola sp. T6c]ABG42119.1 conserved hypothetical protein [Paraglaciecola sp. T6c]
MMTMSSKQWLTALVLTFTFSFTATAGSQANKVATHEPEQIVHFAKNVEKYAASQGARAFIIARVGRPQKDLPKGIRFTHTAVAIYSDITLDDGELVKGYAIYNLYQKSGELDKSQLVTDYPVDFFWGAAQLSAGVIIPTPDMQTRLIDIISTGKNAQLHNENYSVIANPMNRQLQNCTEHTLDMLNAAIYQTTDIDKLKANTQAYFTPQRVHTSRFKLMFGAMLQDDVTTKDHTGKVSTTTFTSIAQYLAKYDLASQSVILGSDGQAVEIMSGSKFVASAANSSI